MGIYDWVTSLTGSWGPALLAAYESNALWINGLVLIYGVLLLLSWQNGDRILDALLRQVIQKGEAGRRPPGPDLRRVRLSKLGVSWDLALAESRFPLVARRIDFWPRRCTPENVRSMISDSYLIKHSASRLKRLGLRLEP
jgi:hypothetical protein